MPAARTATARLRLRPATLMASAYGARQIAVAGAHHDGAMAATVVDRHAALAHARQRSVAAILHVPRRAAHGGHAVAAARAEPALAVAPPQPPRRLALLLAHRGRAGRTARAAGERAAQDQLGQSAGALGLAHLEQPAVEDGRLGGAAG